MMSFEPILYGPLFVRDVQDVNLVATSADSVEVTIATGGSSWPLPVQPALTGGRYLAQLRMREILDSVVEIPGLVDAGEREVPLVTLSADGASMSLRAVYGAAAGKTPTQLAGHWLSWRDQVSKTYAWGRERLTFLAGLDLLGWRSGTYSVKAKVYLAAGDPVTVTLASGTLQAGCRYVTVDASYATIMAALVSAGTIRAWDISYSFSGIDSLGAAATIDGYPLRLIVSRPDVRVKEFVFCNSFGVEDRVYSSGRSNPKLEGASVAFLNGAVEKELRNDAAEGKEVFSGHLGSARESALWLDFLKAHERHILLSSGLARIVVDSQETDLQDNSLGSVKFTYHLGVLDSGRFFDDLEGLGDYNPQQQHGALYVGDEPASEDLPTEDLFFLKTRLDEFPATDLDEELLFLVQNPLTLAWGNASLTGIKEYLQRVITREDVHVWTGPWENYSVGVAGYALSVGLGRDLYDRIQDIETTQTGAVTRVDVGTVQYSPINGVVSLPSYPTTLDEIADGSIRKLSDYLTSAVAATTYHPLGGDNGSGVKTFKIGGATLTYHPAAQGGTPAYMELDCALITGGDQIVVSGTPGQGSGGGGSSYLHDLLDVYDHQNKMVKRADGSQLENGDLLAYDGSLRLWAALSKSTLLNGYYTSTQTDSAISAAIAALNLGTASTYNVGSVGSGNTGLVTGGAVHSAINDAVASALKFQGTTTTAISDGSTTNPITVNGSSYTAKKGDVVLYDGKEYLWTGSAWEQLGDEVSWALKTTTISAGTGLTGGGSLASNRTISLSDSTIASLALANTAYQKPSSGIPGTDLESAVQTSLGKADTALQSGDIKALTLEIGTITVGIYTPTTAKTLTISAQNLYDTIGSTKYAPYHSGGYVTIDTAQTISGKKTFSHAEGIVIGSANIWWDSTAGALRIDQPLITEGDQIVIDGTPGGGGSGGGITLYDYAQVKAMTQDVSLTAPSAWAMHQFYGDVFGSGSSTIASRLTAVENRATSVSVTQVVSSGTKIATITVDSVGTDLYAPNLPLAANGTRGGIQIGYTTSGKNYAVQLSSEKAYVNVPWTDTTYKLTLNGTTVKGTTGGTELGGFYAPTGGGSANQVLIAGGNNTEPSWTNQSNLFAGKATADANGATIHSTYLKQSGGTITGAVNFGDNVPVRTTDRAVAPQYGHTLDFNGRTGFVKGLKVFASEGDYFYCVDRRSDYTITSNYKSMSSTVGEYGKAEVANMFNLVANENFYLYCANLETTPWVLTIQKTNTTSSITATDVLDLWFFQHNGGTYGYLNSYKIEVFTSVYGSNTPSEWHTVIDRSGVQDRMNGMILPVWFVDNIHGAASTYNYGYISGIRITIRKADPTGSFQSGYLPISAIQLRDRRPSHKPSAGIGAMDMRGGSFYGDVTFDYGDLKARNTRPVANNTYYLGTSSYRWSSVYGVSANFSGETSVGKITITSTSAVSHIGFSRNGYSYITSLNGSSSVLAFQVGSGSVSADSCQLVIDTTRLFPRSSVPIKLGDSDYRWSTVYGVDANFSGDAIISGLATLSGGATIPVNKKLTIGEAEIEWIPNSGNGYLKINKPLVTAGDQIVISGTPGGGGSGGATTLAQLDDVLLTSPSNGDLLQYNGSAWVNVAASTVGRIYSAGTGISISNSNVIANTGVLSIGSKTGAITLGANLNISNGGELSATDTTYSNGTGIALNGTVFSLDVNGAKTALGLGTASTYAVASSVTQNDTTHLVTGAAVWTAIDNLPEPMVFKGSLGTDGTITALPVNGSASIGDTYKVITAGTYAGQTAKVGDTFICDSKTSSANTWVLIPSGDEPSGTVTSVAMTVPTGLSVAGSPITTSGTLAISFASGYSIPLTADTTKGVTAYGWGNHASAGYLLATTAASTYVKKDGDTMTGTLTIANEDAPATGEIRGGQIIITRGATTSSVNTSAGAITFYGRRISESSQYRNGARIAAVGSADGSTYDRLDLVFYASNNTETAAIPTFVEAMRVKANASVVIGTLTATTVNGYTLAAACAKGVANNLTTSSAGSSVLDAYQGYLLNNKFADYLALAGGTMTGTIKRSFSANDENEGIRFVGGDKDNYLFTVASSSTTPNVITYGYGLKYFGSGTGVANALQLLAGNQSGSPVIALAFNQNGQVGVKTDADTNYALKINGAAYADSIKIGGATITWNSTDGYLHIDQPLVTAGDQIVISGTPGGGGTGGASYLYQLEDVSLSAQSPVGEKLLKWNGSAWVDVDVDTVGRIYSDGTGISLGGTNNTVINHSNSVTAKTAYGSTATTASANGGTITVTDVKYDAQGHITASTDRTITLSQVDTKNTAGADNTTSKIFLVGPTAQTSSNGTARTYSNANCYASGGKLYSNAKEVVNLSDTQALTNKTYNGYTLAAACAKAVVTSIDTSASLPTSNAVKTFVEGKGYLTSVAFADLTAHPTTLNDYGITDAQPLDADLTAIAALTGPSSGQAFLKRKSDNTWVLDTNTYLTGNQTITLSGDVSGSGTTSISVSIGSGKVTNTMLAGSINWSKLLASSIPTTISGYGITDAKFGTAGTDYIPITLGSTTKNVLTAHQSVTLASGTNNGTLKLTVNGTATDNIAVKGLGSMAYETASNYVLKAGDTMTGDLAIRKSDGGVLSLYGTAHNGNAGEIVFQSMGTQVRNGIKISAVAGGTAYDLEDLVFYTSANKTSPYAPVWVEAMRIKSNADIVAPSFSGESTFKDGIILPNAKSIKVTDTAATPNVMNALYLSNNNNLIIGSGVATQSYNTYIDGYNLRFRTNNNQTLALYIDASGNVGVGTSTTLTSKFTVDGSLTATTVNGYTLAAACAKSVTDSSSASAIGTGTSLPTERDIYYGLPTINNAHNYTSSTTIYAPTGAGTSGYWLKASGGTSEPVWESTANLTAGKATADGDGNTISSTYLKLAGGTMTGDITMTNGEFINAASGYAMLGIGSGGTTFYCGPGNEISSSFLIRSGDIDLTHAKAGTNYKIWDASNSNLSTVSWAANDITAAGSVTAVGAGSFDTLTLTSTSAVAHLAFSRGGYNYITAPSSGSFAFVPNGLATGSANSRLLVSDTEVAITKASGGARLAIQGTTANQAAGEIWFRARSSSYNGVKIIGVQGATSNSYDRIALEIQAANGTSASSVTWKRAMRVTYGANVIIGASGATVTFTQYGDMTINGSITSTGDQVVSSDATLKTNWRDLNYGVTDIARATAGVFDWIDGHGSSAGTKAQDWKKLVPELVHGEEGNMTLAYGQVAMLNTILLARKSEDHEERIKALEAENKKLKEEINRLRMN